MDSENEIENPETIECQFILDICPFEECDCDNCIYYDPDILKLTEDELPF